MGCEGRWSLGDRREEIVENLTPGIGNRVGFGGAIERRRAVVGIDNDLDAVADVVHSVSSGGVREEVGLGVGVDDPIEAAIGDYQIGIVVEAEEGRDGLDPIDDVAMDKI